jgi:hypothetical protein
MRPVQRNTGGRTQSRACYGTSKHVQLCAFWVNMLLLPASLHIVGPYSPKDAGAGAAMQAAVLRLTFVIPAREQYCVRATRTTLCNGSRVWLSVQQVCGQQHVG